MKYCFALALLAFMMLQGCKKKGDSPIIGTSLQLTNAKVGDSPFALSGPITSELPINQPISLTFSAPTNVQTTQASIVLKNGTNAVDVNYSYENGNKTVVLTPQQPLATNNTYSISISDQLKGANAEVFAGATIEFITQSIPLTVVTSKIGGILVTGARVLDVPLDVNIEIEFGAPLNTTTVANAIAIAGANPSTLSIAFSDGNRKINITRSSPLIYLSGYTLTIDNTLQGINGEVFAGLSKTFYTGIGNHTSGLPAKTDNELLDLIQHQTFNYFWNSAMGGHAASGMARERNGSGNTVTTGGSGFGIMAIIVGVERGFITRAEGVDRLKKIVGFLETADRFHGAWSHWINGSNGHVIPFSPDDNGGDLVETSFLIEGLITFRQYLQPADTAGNNLINRITGLYNSVEWSWYRRCDPTCHNSLYWHWSPDKAWVMNFSLSGYFEEQITYVLAASSPTYSIPKDVYESGYGLNGGIVKNNTYTFGGEDHVLPLGSPSPLFWVHYSYLGMTPHITDGYADYWQQNTNATLINHAYCKANPQHFAGYSDACWGLTASDNPDGYGAQSPGNDNGTITPTAALSSFPYTPTESMKALRFFYDVIGDRIWDSTYGPHDAFNVTSDWYANTYLAIDQGPIPVMIENYRTGLLWDLFMSAPEVQSGMTVLNIAH